MQSSVKNSPHSPSIAFHFSHPHALIAIPAGCYRAILREVFTAERKIDEGKLVLRLLFDIVAGSDGPVKFSAALEYPVDKEGNAKVDLDLVHFWNPEEIDQLHGMPTESELVELVETEVDMTIATFTSSDHSPYSRVTGIYPAGDLIKCKMPPMGKDRAHRSRLRFHSDALTP